MGIQLFDTLTAKKVALEPIRPGEIRLYVCGPTVYDYSHLGHARCYVVWDVVVRHLRARGLKVKYVRNYTDVDDKIINRAKERGEDPIRLAGRFVEAYREDMAALGNLEPDIEPKVSEHIKEIVALIEDIVAKGYAYPAANGDVYYAVRKFEGYGRLSKRNLDDLLSGARVAPDEAKRDPLDFALWKAAKPGEPAWPSPWGRGRPGWHIECSAMARKHLGDEIDIHAGGKDLVFPHHTNEIAQSEAVTGKPFARYWLHNGFVEIDSEKMSKSLGNFFTIRDVLAKYDAEAMRYFLLGTHYRNPISFSDAMVAEAERRLVYLYETLAKVDLTAEEVTHSQAVRAARDEIIASVEAELDDDFNTPQALARLAESFTKVSGIADMKKGREQHLPLLAGFSEAARRVGKTLGILQRRPAEALIAIREKAADRRGIKPGQVEKLIAERLVARQAKDFARSDAIRDELKALGVAIMDGPNGSSWKVE
jgi:cysteinyl-tRNA synthetase